MAKKTNKHKTAFIAEHGQAMWDLMIDYIMNGNRSPEAKNAKRLYGHFSRGMNESVYTIYSITEFGKVVYIGMTGTDILSRWNSHKTCARTLPKCACPLHRAMNQISSDHKNFPSYRCASLHTTTDKIAAQALEVAEIAAHGTNKDGYNKIMGGGNTSKKFGKATP